MPRRTRPKPKTLHEHMNLTEIAPLDAKNPITLALRVQEGKCPKCMKRGTQIQMTRPEYRRRHKKVTGYVFTVVKCSECQSEWHEKYVLSEVQFISKE